MLPIQLDGELNNHRFSFEINKVTGSIFKNQRQALQQIEYRCNIIFLPPKAHPA